MSAEPFVKWAGGKRQLLEEIKRRLPKEFNHYYEPFVGGGAVYFALTPKEATINDINEALVNAYRVIKAEPEKLMECLDELDGRVLTEGKEFYYEARARYNEMLLKGQGDIELAALFVFLNKHCFNGLYRVNSKGGFNVPYNNSLRTSYSSSNILEVSKALQRVNICLGDFEAICNRAQKGDFLFLDSPYAPLNASSFEAYTKEGFDIESHKRLAAVFKGLTEKGCYCMLTNHNTELINRLYGDYTLQVVEVKRLINSNANNRTGQEVIVTNYEV